jgi:hypothetical protein
MKYRDKIVDLNIEKSFTDQHLDYHKQLVNPDLLPEWYTSECDGGLLPDALEYEETDILMENEIDAGNYLNKQPSRSSGGNTKEHDIRLDMREYGYKLSEVPPAVYRPDKSNKKFYINGRTRNKILTEFHVKNRIVSIFKKRKGYSEDEANNAISLLGPYFNSLTAPAGEVLEEDIVNEAKEAIRSSWITVNYDEILARITKSSGKGKFTKDKRKILAWRIYHYFTKKHTAWNWKNNSDGVRWLDNHNYKDVTTPTRYIRYKLVSYSTISKNLTDIADIVNSGDFLVRDDAELRVIFGSGELTGYDLKKCYEDRIKGAFTLTQTFLTNMGVAYFDGKHPKAAKVKFYGALPGLEEVDGKPFHNMDKLVKFRQDSSASADGGGVLYQNKD